MRLEFKESITTDLQTALKWNTRVLAAHEDKEIVTYKEAAYCSVSVNLPELVSS